MSNVLACEFVMMEGRPEIFAGSSNKFVRPLHKYPSSFERIKRENGKKKLYLVIFHLAFPAPLSTNANPFDTLL
jgi:hypothetical protein